MTMTDIADRPSPVSITPRDLHFDVGGGRTNDWLGGDVVGTAVFNAFSLTFPEGERLFMDAVREYRSQLTGRLLEEVRAFISQEAVHAREHRSVNTLIDRDHYPVEAIEAGVRERMARVRERGPMVMLCVTIALEHFTAMIADRLLSEDRILAGAPADVARLWQWHAMEEFEHRAVAFDVFNEATRDWPERRRLKARNHTMRLVTLLFVDVVARAAARLLVADGHGAWAARVRVLWFLFGTPGPFRRCLPRYLDWFSADFHPSQHANAPLLDRWRAEFPPGSPQPA